MTNFEKMIWAAAYSQYVGKDFTISGKIVRTKVRTKAIEHADACVRQIRDVLEETGRLHTDYELELERVEEENGGIGE